ncbi:peptidylprolyl isomerase [Ventosimonas gracilis]|uniref:Periplasmic chaperone PpiD n=1 Tax=Ventosimonas gracilis TaxID=1680762 RepID=A0A139SVH6_9GAMM|nr:SurA N-terminal domain-containing protein [Ventosimonas gracilis]KXU38597.1 peptidylprolyl isomerase [Ventosimonas gracilis]
MLQNIRDNSQGWIAKTIIGVIVLLLSLTGFEAIFGGFRSGSLAAKVNGEAISQNELEQAVQIQAAQLAQQLSERLGVNFDASRLDEKELRESALRGLIERRLLLQNASEEKLRFSAQSLDQLILQTPEFQQDGKFSAERFDQAVRSMGYSRMQYRSLLEAEMLIAQMRLGWVSSGFVTDEEVQAFARLERQTRSFASLRFATEPEQVKVSDEDIRAWYQAHPDDYMSPEQVVVQYLELKKQDFAERAAPSEEALQAAYQREIASLAEQRNAAHILIEVSNKLNDAQAKAKIESIAERLAKGEDFAALAKAFSDDTGSADEGGELGYAGRGVYETPFEQALYSLKVGEVSAPVRTDYGWHLIKLLAEPKVPSFASLKAKLEQDIKAQQAAQDFAQAKRSLEAAAFEAADLAQPAQEFNLAIQTTEAFGRDGGEGIASHQDVVQAAWSTDVLEEGSNSKLIDLDADTALVLRVKEHQKSEPLAFEQVASQIRKQLTAQRAQEQAKEKGEQRLKQLREGNRDALEGETWQQVENASRNQEGVDPLLLQTLFRLPHPQSADKPEFSGITLDNGDYLIVRLSSVNEPEVLLAAEEKTFYQQALASRRGAEDFAAFRQQLQQQAKIKRY